jgi:hypothetical protein
LLFPKKQIIFVQGDLADAVFYIQRWLQVSIVTSNLFPT